MNQSAGRVIVSNNPMIFGRFPDVVPVEGGPCEVLKEVLGFLDRGFTLAGHALAGSIRLCCNPYRSLVLEPSSGGSVDRAGIRSVLDAIERVDAAVRMRPVSPELKPDYAFMDMELLESQYEGSVARK